MLARGAFPLSLAGSLACSLAGTAVLALAAAAAGCCVAPPDARQLLAVGFRTPEQAFASFQTAVRADDPGLLRRCLSSGFVARNHLSEQVFRTFWPDLEKKEPLLRKGIADAAALGPAELRGDRSRIRAETHGRKLEVDLVREDFCEAFAGDQRLVDEPAAFRERTGVQPAADGSTWFFGRLALPSGVAPESVTEIRVGREWKIDAFRIEEKGPEPSSADTLRGGDAASGPDALP